MANIYKKLARNGGTNSINVVFVSVDPLRDNPTVLKGFLEYFNPRFLGVTGNKTELDKLAERVGAIYEFENRKTGNPIRNASQLSHYPDYLVNHYSSFIVINPDSHMVAHIYPPHDVERVVNIINLIRNT